MAAELQWEQSKIVEAAGPGEAVVVVVMSHRGRAGGTVFYWQRYDRASGKLVKDVKHEPLSGFEVRYAAGLLQAKKADDVAYIGVVAAGDYVLISDDMLHPHSFCLGAPMMHVEAGSVTYIGGFRAYNSVSIEGLPERQALGWEGDLDRARAALAAQPELAARLVAAPIMNGVQFACGVGAIAYRVPGAPDMTP